MNDTATAETTTTDTEDLTAYVRFVALTERSKELEAEQRAIYRDRLEALADLITQQGFTNGNQLAVFLEMPAPTMYPLYKAARKVLTARAEAHAAA